MVTTERLTIYPLPDSEINFLIDEESDQDLKLAYISMLSGCVSNPEQRIWYAPWAIQRKSDKQIVGDLCFKGLNSDGMVEIGYGIYPEFSGKGFMTEAVTAMAKWAMRQSDVSRVEAEIDPDNIASQKILLKSGFLPTGTIGEEGPRYVYSKNNKVN